MLRRVGNTFVRSLLRSPFHRLLSGSLGLVRVRGRRSGVLHELPVMYARTDASVWVMCGGADRKSWWRNLVDPAPVSVRLRGRDYRATGRAIVGSREPHATQEGLSAWVRRFPRATSRLGMRVGEDGSPQMDDLRKLAARSVMVHIRLEDAMERPGRGKRGLALTGIVGPVFYILLTIVLGLLWEGYNPVRDTQSELGAVDSPYGDLMNIAGFMGLGVTILGFAAGYLLLLRGGIAKTLAVALLTVAGVGMVVVGFFPCDAGCVDVTRTGELHGVWSMPGAIGLPLAAALSASAFRTDGRFGVGWQLVSFWLGLLTLASGPIVAAGLVEGANGLLQRVGMWPPLLWMVAVSWKLSSLAPEPEPANVSVT